MQISELISEFSSEWAGDALNDPTDENIETIIFRYGVHDPDIRFDAEVMYLKSLPYIDRVRTLRDAGIVFATIVEMRCICES